MHGITIPISRIDFPRIASLTISGEIIDSLMRRCSQKVNDFKLTHSPIIFHNRFMSETSAKRNPLRNVPFSHFRDMQYIIASATCIVFLYEGYSINSVIMHSSHN